ncbi:MAG: Mu-like prophage major head subunit gpT family protein, partial [Pirellulaceae bacterium]|nr:Mu-like prophage major head subunit gpT family protein [Pirellulaceae bacterium]
ADKSEARKVYDEQMAAIKAHFSEPEPAPVQWDVDDIRATFDVKGDEFEAMYAKYETDENLPKGKFAEVKATAKKSMRDLRAKAIENKWDAALYAAECDKIQATSELALVRESRPRGPGIHAPKNDPSITNDVLAAAVLQAGRYSLRTTETAADGSSVVKNIEGAETLYPDQVLQTAHTQFKRGIGLQELIVAAAEINGWTGRSFKQAPQECLRYAFGAAPIHATSFSTADMSGILSNVANKFLLQGFFFVENAWQQIAARRSVNDFKTTTAYRLTRGGGFSLVPPSGELKHGTIGEESYTNKADTYGEMLAITRTDIINDDLGAITTVPRSLGRDAGLSMNDVFWTEFLGQISTLFTQPRLNKLSFAIDAASAALSIDSLTLAEKKFMELKDAQGKPIGHMPTILLTSPSLGVTAAKLFNDTEIRVPASSTKTADYTTGNPHAGKFRPVVSRYVSNSAYTGYTSTGWGILADPQDVPIIEMVFLYGVEAPTIEQADADFNTLGIQMRAYLDFGCNAQDYRGGVWSDGSTS